MKQYPTITVRRSVEGPRYVGSPNDPVYDEIVMKDEIPDLPDGTYALVPVDALVIERVMDADGWPKWAHDALPLAWDIYNGLDPGDDAALGSVLFDTLADPQGAKAAWDEYRA